MSKAILHTEISREIDSPFAPEIVAAHLKSQDLALEIGTYDGDDVPFVYRTERIHLKGVVRRWQGTETRIKLVGKVLVPTFPEALTYVLIGMVFLVVIGISFFVINDGANVIYRWLTNCVQVPCLNDYNRLAIIRLGTLTVMMTSWIMSIFISIWLLGYDPYAKQRWRTQQELGQTVDTIFDTVAALEVEDRLAETTSDIARLLHDEGSKQATGKGE